MSQNLVMPLNHLLKNVCVSYLQLTSNLTRLTNPSIKQVSNTLHLQFEEVHSCRIKHAKLLKL